jgi:hypothetical protein
MVFSIFHFLKHLINEGERDSGAKRPGFFRTYNPTVRWSDNSFISLKVNTITCVIWDQKLNRTVYSPKKGPEHRKLDIIDGQTIGRATQELKKHIYGLHKNLDPVVKNR